MLLAHSDSSTDPAYSGESCFDSRPPFLPGPSTPLLPVLTRMLVPVVLGAAIVYAFSIVIYRFVIAPVFVSPLSKIPAAHPTSSLSPAWILWTRWRGRENATVLAAHERLGPLVRLGPNEISVNCVNGGIRTVSNHVVADMYELDVEARRLHTVEFPHSSAAARLTIERHSSQSCFGTDLGSLFETLHCKGICQQRMTTVVHLALRHEPNMDRF